MQELIILWFFIGIPLSLAAGFYVSRLNRNPVVWMLVSLVLSPLIGFAFLAALGKREDAEDEEDDRYPCPYCAEDIKIAAIKCPHCRSDLTTTVRRARP